MSTGEKSCEKCKFAALKQGDVYCSKLAELKPEDSDGKFSLEWAAAVCSICRHYAEPEPSAFEKAMVRYNLDSSVRHLSSDAFLAGWQARGEAAAKKHAGLLAPLTVNGNPAYLVRQIVEVEAELDAEAGK